MDTKNDLQPTTVQPVTKQEITPPPTDPLDREHAADNFTSLNKLFDEPAVPPTEVVTPTVGSAVTEPAPTPVGAEPTQSDKFEESLTAIQADKPGQAKGIEALREISRNEHKAKVGLETKTKELEAKVLEYEQKLKSPEIPEDAKKELEELRAMRREVDIRLDPEFQAKYVKTLQDTESSIVNILKEANLKEEYIKFIQDNGGVLRMAQSNQPLDDKQTMQEWVENTLLAKTPTFHRNRVMSKITAGLELADSMQKELSDHQQNSQSRWDEKMKKLTDDFNAGANEARTKLGDVAAKKTIPSDATPEQKLEIEGHNKLVDEGEKKFQEYLGKSKDPKVAGEIIVKAVQADVLMSVKERLEAQVKELTDKLNKIKAAGSTSQPNQAPPPGTVTQPSKTDLLKQTDSGALGGLLDNLGIRR